MRRLLLLALVVASTSGCSIRKVMFTPLTDGGADRHDALAADAGGHDAPTQHDAATPYDAATPQDAAMAHDAATAEDGSRPDAIGHDAAPRDASTHDAATTGAGGRDGGGHDAAGGRGGDAGPRDAGGHDARDASAHDSGSIDACGAACSCATNLVPVMTGPTTPSGTVTTSGSYDVTSYDGWKAFDAVTSTMWISPLNQVPAWIAYAWNDGPRTVRSYAVTYANGSILTRAPSAWTFEGWNGTAWIVLDTRTSQLAWKGTERRAFTVTSPGSYQRYRLNITDDNDPTAGIVVVSMGWLELLGCPP